MIKKIVFLGFLIQALPASAQQFFKQTPSAERWIDSTFQRLSKNKKIAQLMVVRLSEKKGKEVIFYEEDVAKNIRKYNIGSICLFQGSSVRQAEVVNRLQAKAKTPLLVCIDGETGVGMRFSDVASFPDQLTIGAVSDGVIAYKIGKAIGEQCKRAGIHVNYAPVVDINNNPNNPVINFRSFGEDKYRVSLFGTQIMKGMQDQGIMACAKHFPGHGDVAVDSHLDLPVITKSMQQLDSLELYPFVPMIKEGVGSMMVAHLYIPSIDTTQNRATSLSKNNVTGLLREQMGFKGLTFTDALEMKGVAKFYPQGEAAVQSIIAGNDMLCLPGDIKGSIKRIRKAIRKGELSWDDIDEKVRKILLAKYNLGLHSIRPVDTTFLVQDLNANVNALKKEVYENALTIVSQSDVGIVPLQVSKKIAYIGIGLKGENVFARQLKSVYNTDNYYFDYNSDSVQADTILNKVRSGYDAIIVGVHQFKKYPANNFGISKTAVSLLNQIQQNDKVINFVFGNPYAIKNLNNAKNIVACYEDDPIMQQSAVNFLQGKLLPKGKLPVTIPDLFRYDTGIVKNNHLPFAEPEVVGLNGKILNKIDSIALDAIAKGATPGCVVLVAKDGKIAFNRAYGYKSYDKKEPVTTETVYDLASVTKISATTLSVMKLYEEGRLDLEKTLGDYLPWVKGSDKENLKLRDVLLHQAGLVAFIPFYKETIDSTGKPKPGYYSPFYNEKYSIRVGESVYMRQDYIDSLYKKILDSKLGTLNKYIYSDNDFIFLGKVVEQVTGLSLDEYTRNTFYLPLGMTTTVFKPRNHIAINQIAPTEEEKYFRLQMIRGDVHDPGAAMFGGVAGHAGLFSNALDLSKLYQLFLNGGELNGVRLLKKETIEYFTAYHSDISRRGLGFDKPEKDNATRKEPYPSLSVSPATFGHTGFTGICVWADPKYNLQYIFLSNRVCPDGQNPLLGKLNVRPNIQEVIYQSLLNNQKEQPVNLKKDKDIKKIAKK